MESIHVPHRDATTHEPHPTPAQLHGNPLLCWPGLCAHPLPHRGMPLHNRHTGITPYSARLDMRITLVTRCKCGHCPHPQFRRDAVEGTGPHKGPLKRLHRQLGAVTVGYNCH